MVKSTGGGVSIAVDPYGRTINSSDGYHADQTPMITCLPGKGINTIYSLIGDTFAWLCVLGIITMLIWAYSIEKYRAMIK